MNRSRRPEARPVHPLVEQLNTPAATSSESRPKSAPSTASVESLRAVSHSSRPTVVRTISEESTSPAESAGRSDNNVGPTLAAPTQSIDDRIALDPLSGNELNPLLQFLKPNNYGPGLVPGPPVAPHSAPQQTRPVPFAPSLHPPSIKIDATAFGVSLDVTNAPLNDVLRLLSKEKGLNLVTTEVIDKLVTAKFTNVTLADALQAILTVSGFTWQKQGDILLITRVEKDTVVSPMTQGRQIRIYDVNYADANELKTAVEGILSPVGRVFTTTIDVTNVRKSRERLIVEDLPDYLQRVDTVVSTLDVCPQQVLIEAHILQVDLNETNRHGVNLRNLTGLGGTALTFSSQGLADPTAAPGVVLGIAGGELNSVIEALQQTTDSKTLATPRVLVIDGQQARIQIGQRLGYSVATFNDNQTIESVEFLDVGVVLNVTPTISADGLIQMEVMPEVSNGQIDPNGLPQENTTELSTTVRLPNGRGMIIGGLIQELDDDSEAKLPFFGNAWLIGGLFKRDNEERNRREIIVALTPRIVPYNPEYSLYDEDKFYQATTPVFKNGLQRVDRPWEPRLRNSSDRPAELIDNDFVNSIDRAFDD